MKTLKKIFEGILDVDLDVESSAQGVALLRVLKDAKRKDKDYQWVLNSILTLFGIINVSYQRAKKCYEAGGAVLGAKSEFGISRVTVFYKDGNYPKVAKAEWLGISASVLLSVFSAAKISWSKTERYWVFDDSRVAKEVIAGLSRK